jgi:hypothetical protein
VATTSSASLKSISTSSKTISVPDLLIARG